MLKPLLFGFIALLLCLSACSKRDVPLSELKFQVEEKARLDAEEAARLIQPINATAGAKLIAENPAFTILDVRTPREFSKGRIKGAININFMEGGFADKIAALNPDQTYVLYCRSGNRSAKALPVMQQNNFGTIYHMDGGFNEWKAAGLPIEK